MYNEEISKTNENFARYKERITNFSSEFELGLFLYILRKSLAWIFLIIFLAFLGSLLYLRYTVPIYQSSLVLQINSSNTARKVLKMEDIYEDEDISASIELLRSKFLLNRAIESLPLDVSYFNKGQFLTYELYTSSPFRVQYDILDSSVLNRPFYISFPKDNEVEIIHHSKGEEETMIYKIDEVIHLDNVDLKIVITDIQKMKE